MRKNIEETVWQLAEPIALDAGLFIYDVEFKKEGPEWYLRVFLDKEDGSVSIDDCERVSRPLSDALDAADPIDTGYYLEVSSPGIERLLKRQRDFDRFLGQRITVKLFTPIENTKQLVCYLSGRDDTVTTVTMESGETIRIPNVQIVSVRLAADF